MDPMTLHAGSLGRHVSHLPLTRYAVKGSQMRRLYFCSRERTCMFVERISQVLVSHLMRVRVFCEDISVTRHHIVQHSFITRRLRPLHANKGCGIHSNKRHVENTTSSLKPQGYAIKE